MGAAYHKEILCVSLWCKAQKTVALVGQNCVLSHVDSYLLWPFS